MLLKIPLLTGLLFAAIYPLSFWISHRNPLTNNFHKFHLGLPNFIGGVVVVALVFMHGIPLYIKIFTVIWKILLLAISNYYWKKETVNNFFITIPCVLGIVLFVFLQGEMISYSLLFQKLISANQIPIINFMSVLSGFIFCLALFSMNLGHWYLNVHGLPVSHLLRTTYIFWGFVLMRLILDLCLIVTGRVIWKGESVPLIYFMQQLDGILLWIACFFGALFPAIALYFVYGTLKVKSTQSATGILYVILSAVLIGDVAYKYYFFYYGIAL